MRSSLLLVGVAYAVIYVVASFFFEVKVSDKTLRGQPVNELADADAASVTVRLCSGCHVLNSMENGVGPHLVGVVDRPAGTVAGYPYSEAMLRADLRWTRQRLREFLVDPQRVVPGTGMPSTRMTEDTAEEIVEYLGGTN